MTQPPASPNHTGTPRTDGRCVTTASWVRAQLRQPPRLAYPAGAAPAALDQWRGQVRRTLRRLLAIPSTRGLPPARRLNREPRAGYHLERWEAYPYPDLALPFLLLVPDSATPATPAPLVLCFPGSDCPKEALAGEPWPGNWTSPFLEHVAMAQQVVRTGMVAAAFDNPGTGELYDPASPDWRRQCHQMLWLGQTYEGLSVWHKLAALASLRRLPFVDPQRLAACGHSLGGKTAVHVGVLEPAIKAVVFNSEASSWRRREIVTHCHPVAPWHYIPNFIRHFDYPDLMAAIGPRALLLSEGGVTMDHEAIARAFAEQGGQGQFEVHYMPNFADPAKRHHGPLPEAVPSADYPRYANYDSDHYFKGALAIPWLQRHLA